MVNISKTNLVLTLLVITISVMCVMFYFIISDAEGDDPEIENRIDSIEMQQKGLLGKLEVLESKIGAIGHIKLETDGTIKSRYDSDIYQGLAELNDKITYLDQRVSEIDHGISGPRDYNSTQEMLDGNPRQEDSGKKLKEYLEDRDLEKVSASDRLRALYGELNQEVVDPPWSNQAEIDITQAFSSAEMDGVSLTGIDCRTTMCEIRYSLDTSRTDSRNPVSMELPALLSKSFSHMRMAAESQGSAEKVIFAYKR
jgi:hypothetical protein